MSKKLKSRMLPLTVCLLFCVLAAPMFSGCGKSKKEKEAMARLDAISAEIERDSAERKKILAAELEKEAREVEAREKQRKQDMEEKKAERAGREELNKINRKKVAAAKDEHKRELARAIGRKIDTDSIEGFYSYTVTDGEATITDFDSSYSGALSITNELGGCPVTSIGYSAFGSCRALTTVTIPDSVTTIRRCAFYGSFSLARVRIPDSVTTIGDSAFENCSSLTRVTIGSGVTNISFRAFANCRALTTVTIPNSVTTIGVQAFAGCSSLTSAYFAGNAPTAVSSTFNNAPATVYYLPATTGWGATYAGLPTAVWRPDLAGEDDVKSEEIAASGEAAASSEKDVKPEEIAALKESAASGDDSAQNKLCRFFCESPNKLSTDDFAWFNKLAADGQPWAQFMLGVCYLVAEDPAQATAWMKKSMEEGFGTARELVQVLPKEQSELLTPEGQKKLQARNAARGAAMLDTFAAEFMPKTHARYKQISEKFALTSKTLADLETSIRENGGDPANDETYKVIYERGKTLSLQMHRIRDALFGNYCYRKMEVFTSEDLLKRDNEFAAWVDAEFLTKKAAAPKGE